MASLRRATPLHERGFLEQFIGVKDYAEFLGQLQQGRANIDQLRWLGYQQPVVAVIRKDRHGARYAIAAGPADEMWWLLHGSDVQEPGRIAWTVHVVKPSELAKMLRAARDSTIAREGSFNWSLAPYADHILLCMGEPLQC